MFSLIYYSKEVNHFLEEDLYLLAAHASKKNKRLSITGFLQYRQDHFLQYLEGENEDVLGLMNSIEKDSRHLVLRSVPLQEIEKRRFDNWHMRYWKESEFKYLKLIDLLDIVLKNMHSDVFSNDFLQERITRLVNLMSEHQDFIKEIGQNR